MSITGTYPPARLSARAPDASSAEALLHVSMALIVVALGVSAFAVWTPFGIVATFILTLIVSNAVPAGIPVVIICAFLYQNMMVAWYTPYIPDNDTFDALRGTNFIILMTAFCIFLAASFQHRVRALPELRAWLLLSIVLCGTICFYLALGRRAWRPQGRRRLLPQHHHAARLLPHRGPGGQPLSHRPAQEHALARHRRGHLRLCAS